LQSDIDQEIQIVEEEEVRIRIRRETHQEVLRLQLEEERLRARKTELVVMRNCPPVASQHMLGFRYQQSPPYI